MNIQSLQSSLATIESKSVGGRLDVRSDAPTASHQQSPAPLIAASELPAGANLLQVLSTDEREALAAAFVTEKTPVYTGTGRTVSDPPALLGTQLDLQA
jgi:hypothetical protein